MLNIRTIYSSPMNLHKHQLYLTEQHSKLFKVCSAIIGINTEGKSLIMKSIPGPAILTVLCPSPSVHQQLI